MATTNMSNEVGYSSKVRVTDDSTGRSFVFFVPKQGLRLEGGRDFLNSGLERVVLCHFTKYLKSFSEITP